MSVLTLTVVFADVSEDAGLEFMYDTAVLGMLDDIVVVIEVVELVSMLGVPENVVVLLTCTESDVLFAKSGDVLTECCVADAIDENEFRVTALLTAVGDSVLIGLDAETESEETKDVGMEASALEELNHEVEEEPGVLYGYETAGKTAVEDEKVRPGSKLDMREMTESVECPLPTPELGGVDAASTVTVTMIGGTVTVGTEAAVPMAAEFATDG